MRFRGLLRQYQPRPSGSDAASPPGRGGSERSQALLALARAVPAATFLLPLEDDAPRTAASGANERRDTMPILSAPSGGLVYRSLPTTPRSRGGAPAGTVTGRCRRRWYSTWSCRSDSRNCWLIQAVLPSWSLTTP